MAIEGSPIKKNYRNEFFAIFFKRDEKRSIKLFLVFVNQISKICIFWIAYVMKVVVVK